MIVAAPAEPPAPIERAWAAYGAPTLESLAAAKVLTMRAAFMDGYGRAAGTVTFRRPPGENPRVEARGAPRLDAAPLVAAISDATWNALVEDGAVFDRALVPEPPPARVPGALMPLPMVCMHSWAVNVETVDARGRMRRRSVEACSPDLAVRFAFALAKAAVAADPACAGLGLAGTRNVVTQLDECRMLAGDRAAAAEALKAWNTPWFSHPRGPQFADALAYLFYDFAEVTLPGEPTATGMIEAAKAWVSHGEKMSFRPIRVFGETGDRVRMEGVISMAGPGGKTAPAEMIWVRENGFGFRVRSFKPS